MKFSRRIRRDLPFQLIVLGFGGMIVACLVLSLSTMFVLLRGVEIRAVDMLRRDTAIATRLANTLGQAAPPGILVADLHTMVGGDIALYRDNRVVAVTGFAGQAWIGRSLPGAVARALQDGHAVEQDPVLDGRQFYVRYAPLVAAPGHISSAIVIGVPELAMMRWPIVTANTMFAASMVVLLVFGWVYLRLASRVAASIDGNQRALDHANATFKAAIGSMSQGFAVFKADGALFTCNDRFGAMVGAPPGSIRAGTTLREILILGRGMQGADDAALDAFVAARLRGIAAGRGGQVTVHGSKDQPIVVTEYPIAAGGWVAILEDISEREAAQAEVMFLRRFDCATRLPNRDTLCAALQAALAQSRTGSAARALWPAVLKLEVPQIKAVTDSFGSDTTDALLNEIKLRLQKSVRENDVLARVGPDKFAVLQAGSNRESVSALAARLLDHINGAYEIHGHSLAITASAGIALAPDHGRDAETLLKSASIATRVAATRPGSWRVFEPEMEGTLTRRLALEAELGVALAGGQFEVFYQPLINLASDRISCFEALLRWQHPTRGMISPADFIPMAEETGLIVPIGAWVLERACTDAMRWPCNTRVAVNLSALQVREPNLVQTVQTALDRAGLLPTRLELEVTETVLLEGDTAAMRVLHALRGLGVRISMDDFGTGHSSLSYLRDFPFDKIKIDKSFVHDMLVRDECMAIIRAVTSLANSLHIAVVAEGAETAEQVARLRLEGCTEVQGFFYARPRPAIEAQLLLQRFAHEDA